MSRMVRRLPGTVLNDVDMAPGDVPPSQRAATDTGRPLLYCPDMPAPAAAPAPIDRLWAPRLSLSACIRAIMARDTRGAALQPEQRLNYFPATPLCSIAWTLHGSTERVLGPFPQREARLDDPREPVVARVVLTGPFNQPSVSWNPGPLHGMMLLLMPDALQSMTGLDPAIFVNRIVDANGVLPPDWCAMCEAVATATDDATRVRLIEDFLEPRWQAVRPRHGLDGHRYQDWAQGLAMRAAQSAAGRSLRQVERRIKQWAGQPMRELQGIGRIERAFFEVMAAEAEDRLHWAELAADCGYADQSHLSRVTRRMTGFSPEELRRRIHGEAAFWAYRLWQ
ncbi:helix-turn-helix domain-containing protein [Eleftheria terrae]|uniref:helix-turn-helix domain-containing protein n=1 Tax=Eleftheria terrae TaxID=1597781 RepID=UPI00263B3B3C|nr:AraC family transcriptional regulator [Eleftheria terrae]WKB53902.1 AraC family transcriptional regulator [Eleftheria terrae]